MLTALCFELEKFLPDGVLTRHAREEKVKCNRQKNDHKELNHTPDKVSSSHDLYISPKLYWFWSSDLHIYASNCTASTILANPHRSYVTDETQLNLSLFYQNDLFSIRSL